MEKVSFHHGGTKLSPWWNEMYTAVERINFSTFRLTCPLLSV
jgi:hypothetical protein